MTDADQPLTREERLAARLRENLKRRKAQARAMDAATMPDGAPDAGPSPESALPKSADGR